MKATIEKSDKFYVIRLFDNNSLYDLSIVDELYFDSLQTKLESQVCSLDEVWEEGEF